MELKPCELLTKTEKKKLLLYLSLILIPVIIFCVLGLLLPPIYSDTFLGELHVKYRKLKSTAEDEGPRIILIGGSNTVFGIDSDIIEEELSGYKVINFGMYAGLGTKIMLDLAEKYINSGDVVVIIPEQQSQSLSMYVDGKYLWQALDSDLTMLNDVSPSDYSVLFGAFPEYALEKNKYALTGKSATADSTEKIYLKASFDENGEIKSSLIRENIMPEGFDVTTPVVLEEEMMDEDAIIYFNKFAEKIDKRGAFVYYHYSPMNEGAVSEEEHDKVANYHEWLQHQLLFPVLGSAENAILPAEDFYDTNFHLNAFGRVVFTVDLVKDIKAEMLDSSYTQKAGFYAEQLIEELNVSAVQESVKEEDFAGIPETNTYFLFEKRNSGIFITGLTPEARAVKEIQIPDFIDQKPVIGIGEMAFNDADWLESITIGKNVASIMDTAFYGCSALKKIILPFESPKDCQVGQNLLDGTGAFLYVPEDVLNEYKLSYWWSAYSDHLKTYQNS